VRWFERLDHLSPGTSSACTGWSRGWPWSTWIVVQWSAELQPKIGEPYVNQGAHWLHLRGGKVVGLYAYLDSQLVAKACEAMAKAGVADATASPILD
jgi:ketosteroid isomerase-like protein